MRCGRSTGMISVSTESRHERVHPSTSEPRHLPVYIGPPPILDNDTGIWNRGTAAISYCPCTVPDFLSNSGVVGTAGTRLVGCDDPSEGPAIGHRSGCRRIDDHHGTADYQGDGTRDRAAIGFRATQQETALPDFCQDPTDDWCSVGRAHGLEWNWWTTRGRVRSRYEQEP